MDTIADLLVRISNAKGAKHSTLVLPFSNLKEAVLGVLKQEGYVNDAVVDKTSGIITIDIREPKKHFSKMNRISKPGRRIYTKSKNIPRPKNGHGIVILSTPIGVLSGEKARQKRQGGEVICEVF